MHQKIFTFLRIFLLIIYIIKPTKYYNNHVCYQIPLSEVFKLNSSIAKTGQEIFSFEEIIQFIILAKSSLSVDGFQIIPNRGRMTALGMEESNSPDGRVSSPSGNPAENEQFYSKCRTLKFVPQVYIN